MEHLAGVEHAPGDFVHLCLEEGGPDTILCFGFRLKLTRKPKLASGLVFGFGFGFRLVDVSLSYPLVKCLH